MAEQTKRDRDRLNFGGSPGTAVALAGLNNPIGGSRSAQPAVAPGVPAINVGFGQTRAAVPSPRAPSLAQRALAGEFQTRPRIGAPAAPVNVGMGAPAPARPAAPRAPAAAVPAPASPAAPVRPMAAAAAPLLASPAASPAAAPAAAPAVARPNFSNVATRSPGDPNTYTGANGVTRTVQPAPPAPAAPAQPPILARPAAIAAPASNAPQVQQAVGRALEGQRGQTLTARADAAAILNPMGADAEILRRLENSQNSYFNKGSPQARRIIGEAIAAQLGARNAASAQGQAAGNATLQQGVVGEGFANEGAARREMDAAMFNADDGYRREALAADIQRPTLQADAQGGLQSITGTTATPVTGADGTPVRLARPATEGALTPAALLESYTEQSRAINEGLGTPEEKVMQQAALRSDPLFAELFAAQQPGRSAAPPTLDQFMARARQANPGASDADLRAYYATTYGNR